MWNELDRLCEYPVGNEQCPEKRHLPLLTPGLLVTLSRVVSGIHHGEVERRQQ